VYNDHPPHASVLKEKTLNRLRIEDKMFPYSIVISETSERIFCSFPNVAIWDTRDFDKGIDIIAFFRSSKYLTRVSDRNIVVSSFVPGMGMVSIYILTKFSKSSLVTSFFTLFI